MTKERIVKDRTKSDKILLQGRVDEFEIASVVSPVMIVGHGVPDYEDLAQDGLGLPLQTESMPPDTTFVGINAQASSGAISERDLVAAVAGRQIQLLGICVLAAANNHASAFINVIDGSGGTTIAVLPCAQGNRTAPSITPMNWKFTAGNAVRIDGANLAASGWHSIIAVYRVLPA